MFNARAFISGIIIPSIFIPFGLTIWAILGHREVMNELFVHWLPIIWGLWNVFYFAKLRDYLPVRQDLSLFLTGAILGILVSIIGVFIIGIPAMIGIPNYFPLIFVPVLYGIVWLYLVKPLNNLLGVN
jgi:hypothetical protein